MGRRPLQGPEVYVVTAVGVERLRSEEHFGTPELDWFAPGRAAIELARVLLTRLVIATPSQRLTSLLALDVISQLDDDGFVLSSARLLGWVQQFSRPGDWVTTGAPARRSWIARAWQGLDRAPKAGF